MLIVPDCAIVRLQFDMATESKKKSIYAFTVMVEAKGYDFDGFEEDPYNIKIVNMKGRYKVHISTDDPSHHLLNHVYDAVKQSIHDTYYNRCPIRSFHKAYTYADGMVHVSLHSPLMLVTSNKEKFRNLNYDIDSKKIIWQDCRAMKYRAPKTGLI